MADKRRVEERLRSVRTLGEAESGGEDDVMAWVQRSRKLHEVRCKLQLSRVVGRRRDGIAEEPLRSPGQFAGERLRDVQRGSVCDPQQQKEEEDARRQAEARGRARKRRREADGEGADEEEGADEKDGGGYSAKEMAGMKVKHAGELELGETAILTLNDRGVLDEQGNLVEDDDEQLVDAVRLQARGHVGALQRAVAACIAGGGRLGRKPARLLCAALRAVRREQPSCREHSHDLTSPVPLCHIAQEKKREHAKKISRARKGYSGVKALEEGDTGLLAQYDEEEDFRDTSEALVLDGDGTLAAKKARGCSLAQGQPRCRSQPRTGADMRAATCGRVVRDGVRDKSVRSIPCARRLGRRRR